MLNNDGLTSSIIIKWPQIWQPKFGYFKMIDIYVVEVLYIVFIDNLLIKVLNSLNDVVLA